MPASRYQVCLPESLEHQRNLLLSEKLNESFRPVWNAMRRLPFTEEEIAGALATIAMLHASGFRFEDSTETQLKKFSEHFGESMQVEFANEDGSGSKGYADLTNLRDALRKDVPELLTEQYQHRAELPDLFRVIYNPKLMFDFESLKKLFALQVIPTQVLLKRDALIANPARLTTFGLP
jgi:hypothetical protein